MYEAVKHRKERYGAKEIESWYLEVWNEPDGSYWVSSIEEYCKLYDYSVDGAVAAHPKIKIGGPCSCPGRPEFLDKFLAHCDHDENYVTGEKGTRLD
ncbi:hypothetical protein J7L29_02755 [Candidatus Bathyarchaeota archaeon]|nr:hypothetical protein [Candidatus Bathyarchaeota archaeon]